MSLEPMIPIHLARVVLREGHPQQWIQLAEVGGPRSFSIVIGLNEASEIRRVLHGEELPRPLTHSLIRNVIEGLEARLVAVEIVELRENTFHAELVLEDNQGREVRVDARPSDAVAVGLRAGCPLRVAESILEEVRSDTGGPPPTGGQGHPGPPDSPGPPTPPGPAPPGPGGSPGGSGPTPPPF